MGGMRKKNPPWVGEPAKGRRRGDVWGIGKRSLSEWGKKKYGGG